MRCFLFILVFFSVTAAAQKRKKTDVVSNIEVKVLAMKPVGNNSLAQNLQPFYGYGFGGNLMTPINFGVGIDYSQFFSNVKYGRRNLYGNLGSPKLTVVDAFLTHREEISEDFFVEEIAGFSFYKLTDYYIAAEHFKHKTNGVGFLLGAKAIYTLDGPQQVFLAAKANYYNGNMYNENPEIRRYYNQSFLLSLSFGYRYNF